uniref:Uncharacterized protein n=1 Tax=Romanomermis culicivorax TaxID=13658 RepID=A0A915IC35_ROMCU
MIREQTAHRTSSSTLGEHARGKFARRAEAGLAENFYDEHGYHTSLVQCTLL